MSTTVQPHEYIAKLIEHAGDRAMFMQLLVLGLVLLGAWLASYSVRRSRERKDEALGRAAQIGRAGARRLVFPLTGVLLSLLAKLLFSKFGADSYLFGISATLLFAMALVRMAVFALQQAFSQSELLATFERSFVFVVWTLVAIHLLGLTPELIDVLESVSVPLGKQKLTLWLVLQGAATVIVTMLVALWLAGLIDAQLGAINSLDSNLRAVFSRLSKALLVVLAIMIALPLVGIDLTALSVFSGALGVGLGLGLQKIASNYVSGFIILIDRSLRLGNLISVDRYRGEVTQINTRYTVLRALTGVEAIVPNEMLVSSVVENETLTTARVRMALEVQVAYDSDLEQVMAVLEAAPVGADRVLDDPPAKAFLKAFGDSGITFELGVWIRDPQEGQIGVRSEINLRIWREFKRLGISIPFPQREVRVHEAAPVPPPETPKNPG